MLSDGTHRYLFVEWNPMGSMGIQWSPSMSIGITGLVVNLTSDKCSIHEICLVLRALKRNMKYGPFFKPWSKTVHFKRGQRKINLAFLLKAHLNAVYVGNASFFKTKSETARIKREWLRASFGALRRHISLISAKIDAKNVARSVSKIRTDCNAMNVAEL